MQSAQLLLILQINLLQFQFILFLPPGDLQYTVLQLHILGLELFAQRLYGLLVGGGALLVVVLREYVAGGVYFGSGELLAD